MGGICSVFHSQTQVHAGADIIREQQLALQRVEELLAANAQRCFEDVYEALEPVGHGAFAKVLRCRQRDTGQYWACKVIPQRSARQASRRQGIIKEMAVMMLVGEHPNTIALHDAFETEDCFYLVLELCCGGELFDRIVKQKHMSEKEAAEIMRCLLDFLAFLHSRGVVHRDLKPENILLGDASSDAHIQIIDFGTSDFCAPGQRLQERFGTPYYVAPEVLSRKGHGVAADVWSAGVIAYILLCGYPPFAGNSDRSILARVRRGYYSFAGPEWKEVSAEAKAFIRRALVLDPNRRATAASLLDSPWIRNAHALSDKAFETEMLKRLQAFSALSQMMRLSLALLASTLGKQQARRLKEAFYRMDKDHSGSLDPLELREALLKAGLPAPPEAELRALFGASDMRRQGALTYLEFVTTMLDSSSLAQRDDIIETVFSEFDQDGDGFITEAELASIVTAQGFGISHEDIVRMVAENDLDGDGKINLAEFSAMIRRDAPSAIVQAVTSQRRRHEGR